MSFFAVRGMAFFLGNFFEKKKSPNGKNFRFFSDSVPIFAIEKETNVSTTKLEINMKKGILLIVGLLVMNLTVWAGNDKPIEVKKMPKAAQQFIQAYFGTHSVAVAKMETDFMSRSYDVIFTNGDKVEFDKKGNWKNVDCEQGEVPAAIIPEGIQMYLTQHYPNVKDGGPYFSGSMLATADVMEKLEQCTSYAPLHTPAHIMGIKGCTAAMPKTPQVLVFDTAFHQTMSKEVYMYGLSYDMYEDYGIRRYGAHGTSHRYVSAEMIKIMGGDPNGTKIVTCHIGNGSSISAVKDGKCVDTSMGFTPLEGVMMGTRCGSIDPAIVSFIMEKKNYTTKEVDNYLNKKCGFDGVSGVGSDSRDIERAMNEGNERAKLAYDMLCYQIKKYIGAYSASMGGLNAIVFTAGIGEHSVYIRENALKGLEYLGVKLDKERNTFAHSSVPVKLSTDDSAVAVYMIPTNEELVIAQDTARIVSELNA